jgi:hypothetical protein
MEIMKEIISNRLDYLQALRNAPAPVNKLSGQTGKVVIPASINSISPHTLSTSVPSTPTALQSTGHVVSPIPKTRSLSFLKYFLIVSLIGGSIILIYNYSKQKDEENK